MNIIRWRPHTKGALRGFVSVDLANGLVIDDCTVMIGKNGPFVALPAKPALDRDGRQKRDANNTSIWQPLLHWKDHDTADAFSTALIELLLRQYPDGLEDHRADESARE
jgi:DNA-binding cell septation regulator SpoVG